MRNLLFLTLLATPGVSAAQAIQPGRWDVVSTMADLAVPGAPGFIVRMMKGKSKAEHKCVTPDQAKTGVAALLAPDPKAQCHVDSLQIAGGRYAQTLTCPQKKGPPMQLSRSGTYDAAGFAGRVKLAGPTPKGPMTATIDQRTTHLTGTCRG
ncbi:DUF3617 domain-containing protein [uncultured Sphingomonas sp.]|uniref:DUF3617 domain-containing protein n=1 Tax=uncultured Sphingomonas sp. TaxID=158754 RepID=UPI0035CBC29C